MRTLHRILIATVLLVACGARADEVEVSKVPAGGRKAAEDAVKAKTALKSATWTAAEKYTEGKVVKFDLEGEPADKTGVFITLTAAGAVEELREQVDFDKTPAAVKKAVRYTVPGFKVVHEQGKLARYDVEVVRMNGDEMYSSITPSGKLLKN